jgi:hypothetical protein
MGFLAQTFATPLLLTAMAHLAQILSPRRWKPGEAMLAGLLAAGLASTYPPFLPLLGGAWTRWLVDRGRLKPLERWPLVRWGVMAAAIAATVVALQGVNLPGAFAFLRGTLVGGHVDLSPWGFVQAALGAWFWTPFRLPPTVEFLRSAHLLLTPVYLWLTARGLRLLAGDSRSRPLFGCLAVLAGAVLWYGLAARDPWTAERGHTWNLFKLTQWSFAPLGLALVHGLASLRRHPWGRWVGPVLLLAPITMAPVYWSFAGRLGASLEAFVGSRRALHTWGDVRQRFLQSPDVPFLAADTPAGTTVFLPTYLGLLTYPHRLSGNWEGALWIPPNPANGVDRLWSDLARSDPARNEPLANGNAITPIVTSLRGFVTDAVVPLGGGIGLVKEPTAASVLAVLQPSDDEPGPGGCVWIGNARAHLLVFSPGAMRARLRLTTSAGSESLPAAQRIVVASQGESHDVQVHDDPRVDLPVLLGRGTARVEVSFPEAVARAADRHRLCVLSMKVERD